MYLKYYFSIKIKYNIKSFYVCIFEGVPFCDYFSVYALFVGTIPLKLCLVEIHVLNKFGKLSLNVF